MKKTIALVSLIFLVSSMSVGCTISPPSEWCRRGSLWPFNRNESSTASSESFVVPSMSTPVYMQTSMPGCCVPSTAMDTCAGQGFGDYGIMPSAGNEQP